jgi:hypothetical protein
VDCINVGAGSARPYNRVAVSSRPCWRDLGLLLFCSVGAGSARPNIVPQFLTLLLLSYIYFVVFLYVLFSRKKNQKLPAHGLSKSLTPLLGNSANMPRSSLS